MSKYYYTDPLEAAYMGKHHGFKFESCYGFELRPYNKGWEIYHEAMSTDVKYFDSKSYFKHSFDYDAKGVEIYMLHNCKEMLQPQINDLYRYVDTEGFSQVAMVYDIYDLNCDKGKVCNRHYPNGVVPIEIIQRNGQAFFMPKNKE